MAIVLSESGSRPSVLAAQDQLSLVHDPDSGNDWLVDPRTQEVVKLIPAPAGEKWALVFEEEHQWAVLESDSESHCCNEFLSFDVYSVDGGYMAVHRSSGAAEWLSDLFPTPWTCR